MTAVLRLGCETAGGGAASAHLLAFAAEICDNIRMLIAQDNLRGFTPAQYEVVNLMSCLGDDADIAALKSVLVKFLDARLQKELDRLYDDGTLSDSRMEELASAHLRTPYKAAVS